MEIKESEIEFLGQKISYPKTIYGAAFSLGLFALVAFTLYTILVLAKSENLGIIAKDVVVGAFGGNGDFERKNVKQFQFWTPSSNTTLLDDSGEEIKWLANVEGKAEKMNHEFGALLSENSNVYGYRRYIVFGKGRSQSKEGMWWVVNAKKDFDVEELAKIYQRFWKTEQSIYIEQYYHNGELN